MFKFVFNLILFPHGQSIPPTIPRMIKSLKFEFDWTIDKKKMFEEIPVEENYDELEVIPPNSESVTLFHY